MSDEKKGRELKKALDEVWFFYEGDKLTLSEFLRSEYKGFKGNESRKNKEKANKIEAELDKLRKKIQQIRQLIQQKPEIDEKYVEEKVGELSRLTVFRYKLFPLLEVEEWLTQIIRDLMGR